MSMPRRLSGSWREVDGCFRPQSPRAQQAAYPKSVLAPLARTGSDRTATTRPEAADLVRGGGDARGVGDVQDEQPGTAADLRHGVFSARRR
jgi:hypothetical protein